MQIMQPTIYIILGNLIILHYYIVCEIIAKAKTFKDTVVQQFSSTCISIIYNYFQYFDYEKYATVFAKYNRINACPSLKIP